MALTEATSGTQSATLDTEHTLATETSPNVYVLAVNLANMASGDVTILRIKTKVLSGGSHTLAFTATFAGAQTEDVVYSEPVPSVHSAQFTLEQTDGTGRNYEWSVIEVG